MNAVAKTVALPLLDERSRIQTMRGLACLLLVSFHVIGDEAGGLRVAGDSLLREFTNIFLHLRMPLFAFLSGFVYAYKPIQPGGGGLFTRKKLNRLLYPLLLVSTAYFVLQQVTPGTNRAMPWSQMWEIYVYPFTHFWFLQAIIVIFLGLAVAEHFRWLSSRRQFVVALVLILAAHFWLPTTDLFSVNRALYLVPFFLLGLGANRFNRSFNEPVMQAFATVALVALMTYHVMACLNGDVAEKRTYFATALSLVSCLTFLYWMPPVRWLAWLGAFSFSIYLYHVFFSAGVRIALNQIHVTNLQVHFIVGCALACLGPILVEWVLKRNKLASRALLGQ